MDHSNNLKQLISGFNDPVINTIIESLVKLYEFKSVKSLNKEFLIVCDGIKVSICANNNEVHINSIDFNKNKKNYHIIYDDEIITLIREYEKNKEKVIRKQKFIANDFFEEEYTKCVDNQIVQKTISFSDPDKFIYLCTEYNGHPKKTCQKTNNPLFFSYTDFAVLEHVPDFIIYDKILENLDNENILSKITLSEFNKKYYEETHKESKLK